VNAEQPRRRRLGRAEAKARTRRLVLEAAARSFARKGFSGSSVEDIAETAGFSVGALYSNFANKEELFLELSSTYNSDRIAEAAAVLLGKPRCTGEAVNELGRVLVDAADKDGDFALLQAEFWLYAVRNPQVLERMAERMRTPRRALEQLVASALEPRQAQPEATAKSVATVVAALFDGLVRQRRIDPSQVPEELFKLTLQWLFNGIWAVGAPSARATDSLDQEGKHR
jgi:AcrR family transcriptional regulator